MHYQVELINKDVDSSTADVVLFSSDDETMSYYIMSSNVRMKAHLERLLKRDAYIMSPGGNEPGQFTDGITHLYPNTAVFFQCLPQILSWYGYRATYIGDTHKSIYFYDDVTMIMKSADGMYQNAAGETIVQRVPAGYIAVHQDGRVVASGRWLNANIDKEGAEWTLVENPHENLSSVEREYELFNMEIGGDQYHPGVEQKLYDARQKEDDETYFRVDPEKYKPSGTTLRQHFAKEISARKEKENAEAAAQAKKQPTQQKQTTTPPGEKKIYYNPLHGHAVSSDVWPPTGAIENYENLTWYEYSDELHPKEKSSLLQHLDLQPELIDTGPTGITKSTPFLDTSSGVKVTTLTNSFDLGLDINEVGKTEYPVTLMESADFQKQCETSFSGVKKAMALTNVVDPVTGLKTISPELDEMVVDDLEGANGVFKEKLASYQKAGVLALTDMSQYEAYGGPVGHHGRFLNWSYGSGKTAVVVAADTVLRNRGIFKSGEQTTIVTAPNKNVMIWESEIKKFSDRTVFVIDGTRGSRIAQWEELLQLSKTNRLPTYVVVGSSKFRYVEVQNRNVEREVQAQGDTHDAEDAYEVGIDAQYMRILALGGKTKPDQKKEEGVAGGHVAALVIDESGQYVNVDAARHHALLEVVDAVAKGKGITWTLNGDVSGNSATDTISELAFINSFVRENYVDISNRYTTDIANVMVKEGEKSGKKRRHNADQTKRIWRDRKHLDKFVALYGRQIYSLSGTTIAGANYGLTRTPDMESAIGKNWGEVYTQTAYKLQEAMSAQLSTRALGMLTLLINASYGAASVQRLLEYDIANSRLLVEAAELIASSYPPDKREVAIITLKNEVNSYIKQTTEDALANTNVGRVPKPSMSITGRDAIYQNAVSQENRDILDKVLARWDNPVVDRIIADLSTELSNNQTAGKNMKFGIAGFSKKAIHTIFQKLKLAYPTGVLINLIDGDTSPKEVNNQQQQHQSETSKPVISLVTGAGLYGLSLPADRTWRFATWNPSKGGQYEGRFHRNPTQENRTTVVVPTGIVKYMRELELAKGKMADAFVDSLLNVDEGNESDLELTSKSDISSFVERLFNKAYMPTILDKEREKG